MEAKGREFDPDQDYAYQGFRVNAVGGVGSQEWGNIVLQGLDILLRKTGLRGIDQRFRSIYLEEEFIGTGFCTVGEACALLDSGLVVDENGGLVLPNKKK